MTDNGQHNTHSADTPDQAQDPSFAGQTPELSRPLGVSAAVLDVAAFDIAMKPEECRFAKTDLFFLAYNVLGYKDINTVWHRKLCKKVVATRGYFNRMFLVPRGTFKTTLLTITDSIQLALNDPDIRLAIMSSTGKLAQRILKEIKWHFIMNERLRHLFPEYAIDGKEWGTKESVVVPCRTENYGEGTFEAIGADEHVTSKHFNHFKKDDLQDLKNATTDTMLGNLDDWDKSTIPLGYPMTEARHDYIGTAWAHNDLYVRVKKRIPGLFYISRDAERGPDGEEGKLLCPSVLSQEVLDRLKIGMGLALYYSQYRIKRINPEDAVFQVEDVKACVVQECVQQASANFAVIVDPAFGTKARSCDAAIIGLGTDMYGDPWIVDARIGKFKVHELIKETVDMAIRLKALRTYVETISEKALGQFIEDALREEDALTIVETIDSHGFGVSKDMRIQRLEPLIRGRRLKLWAGCPQLEKILEQFIMYPRGLMDAIDAIAIGTEHAMPYLSPRSAPPPMTSYQKYFAELRKDRPNMQIIATRGRGRGCDPMFIDRNAAREVARSRRRA